MSECVTEQFLNGISAQYNQFSAIKLDEDKLRDNQHGIKRKCNTKAELIDPIYN